MAWYKDCNSQVIVAALKEDEFPLLTPVYAYVPVIYVVCQRLYGCSSEEICEFMLLSKYLVLKLVSWWTIVVYSTTSKATWNDELEPEVVAALLPNPNAYPLECYSL